ncbi:low-molecular-weight cysteine-rich protein LCR59 precursor [Salix suchowensis]|nr:low-molecular-weight cysteine-rich protein LCR59 precursor [Salix suchowensis]
MARFFHYVLFIFAAGCCVQIGACAQSCDDICRSKYPEGGEGACQDDNCVCFFECGIEKRCNVVGLGRCSSQCSESCCAAKCAQKVLRWQLRPSKCFVSMQL